jgi:uncharacterized protein YecE (DUF72 family)
VVYIGCSGWNYKHWRNGVFYPPRLPASRWLEFYAERLSTVEVNATFYRLPRRSNVKHWMEQTPSGFLFTVKASRYLTHIKRLRGLRAGLKRFYARIAPLARSPKMGPVLWQLPENFRRRIGPSCAFTTGAARETTRRRSSNSGHGGSSAGHGAGTCTRTSTTTSEATPHATRSSCSSF